MTTATAGGPPTRRLGPDDACLLTDLVARCSGPRRAEAAVVATGGGPLPHPTDPEERA